ncbi:ROK family sugar kinase [Prochlorococcus sp. SS52]|nr:ROK family sugar kinase [Prochlorococcus sp. SS52]
MLCEAIDLLDDGAVNSIVVIIPGVIDKTGRFVESWIGNPLWVDIPLADWLEIRLKIKVVLAGKNSFSFIKDLSVFSYHLKNSFSLFYQSSSS